LALCSSTYGNFGIFGGLPTGGLLSLIEVRIWAVVASSFFASDSGVIKNCLALAVLVNGILHSWMVILPSGDISIFLCRFNPESKRLYTTSILPPTLFLSLYSLESGLYISLAIFYYNYGCLSFSTLV
jgi:hypothetical protein